MSEIIDIFAKNGKYFSFPVPEEVDDYISEVAQKQISSQSVGRVFNQKWRGVFWLTFIGIKNNFKVEFSKDRDVFNVDVPWRNQGDELFRIMITSIIGLNEKDKNLKLLENPRALLRLAGEYALGGLKEVKNLAENSGRRLDNIEDIYIEMEERIHQQKK
ncbi:MAG: hypothetical protein ACJZ0Y_03545 [Cytophagales bacterium]